MQTNDPRPDESVPVHTTSFKNLENKSSSAAEGTCKNNHNYSSTTSPPPFSSAALDDPTDLVLRYLTNGVKLCMRKRGHPGGHIYSNQSLDHCSSFIADNRCAHATRRAL